MWGIRGTLAAAVAACAAITPWAHAQPAVAAHVHAVNTRVDLTRRAVDFGRPRDARQLRERHLAVARARLALDGAVGSGSSAEGAPGPFAISAAVPTGSGRTDVAVLTMPSIATASVLSVRDGHTGRVRWHRQLQDAWAFDTARLGTPRRPAIVVYETSFTGTDSVDPIGAEDDGEQTTTIVVLDAATGTVVWTLPAVTGTYSVSDLGFTEANALYPAAVLHDRAGDRLLALDVTQSFSIAAYGSQAQPIVYDGATGAASAVGAPVAGDDLVMATPAGDLDGDGAVDWYSSVGGDMGAVVATAGADGAPLWGQPIPQPGFLSVVPVGDIDGDHRPDVAVGASGGLTSVDGTVTVYSGAAGSALFSRAGVAADPLGDIHGVPAVAVWDESFAAGDGVTATALTRGGRVLWSRTVKIPSPTGGGGLGDVIGGSIEFGGAGDVDGDHVSDLFADMAFAGRGVAVSTTTVIDGRTGAAKAGSDIGVPLGLSLDGAGTDFITMSNDLTHWRATVYDGRTRHKLWSTMHTAVPKPFLLSLDAARLGAESQTSLVLSLWTGNNTHVLAIGGRTGRTHWDVIA